MVGLCQKCKQQHPHHVKVSPRRHSQQSTELTETTTTTTKIGVHVAGLVCAGPVNHQNRNHNQNTQEVKENAFFKLDKTKQNVRIFEEVLCFGIFFFF